MLNRRLFEIGTGCNRLSDSEARNPDVLRDLPDVPVLAETLLLMELKTHERSVDLEEVSQLVLGDPGAALQIMRMASSEFACSEGRPTRIADCVSDLGLQVCLDAMSKRTIAREPRRMAIVDAWMHARTIAQFCSLIAEDMPGKIRQEEAHLVGLFHELGTLPALLGWNQLADLADDQDLAGLRMAEMWSLPSCVVGYFCELRLPRAAGHWRNLVEKAHSLAAESSMAGPVAVES